MTEQLTEQPVETTAAPAAPGPVRIPWAMVPRVNLLPMEIIEARKFRQTRILLGVAVLGTLLIAAAGVFWAQQGVQDANDQLTVSQAKVTVLNAEKAKYAAVPKIIAQVDAAQAARTLAMEADVLWYRYLNDLDDARPAGVTLTAMTLTLNSVSAAPAPPSDPLGSHAVGTLTLGGTAEKYQQVAGWLEALEKLTGISSAALSEATEAEGEDGVTFSSTAVIDTDALSHRFDEPLDVTKPITADGAQ
jgi:Tfp pilus assembly protein PilN